MRYLSVCSGIEAATVAWHGLGWEPAAFSEIEAFPSAVLSHHYPSVPNLGDMTRYKEWNLGTIDLLVGGTPCQSFSVAGLRKGLEDPRGNLALTFLAIADHYKPKWIVWENVPGVLSSNKGKDFESFLDGLEELGYILDCDILDAQFHGVAQRRRRVFVCAQHRDYLLKNKTTSSALTIAQCWQEILLSLLVKVCAELGKGRPNLDLPYLSNDGAMRRMKLFGLDGETGNYKILQENLVEAFRKSLHEPNGWDANHGKSEKEPTQAGLWKDLPMDDLFTLTEQSLKKALGESYEVMKSCITLTPTSSITTSQIYTCFQAALLIAKLIQRLNPSSQSFWSAATSALTTLEEYTSYARQTSNQLFQQVGGFQNWSHIIEQAERTTDALGNTFVGCFGKVFPVSESLSGHPAPSREAGKTVAPTVTQGPPFSRTGNQRVETDAIIAMAHGQGGAEIRTDGGAPTLTCVHEAPIAAYGIPGNWIGRKPENGGNAVEPMHDIAPCLTKTDRHGVAVAQPIAYSFDSLASNSMKSSNPHSGCRQVDVSKTLDTTTPEPSKNQGGIAVMQPVIAAFKGGQGSSAGGIGYSEHVAPTLPSNAGGNTAPTLLNGMAVRRLTPVECERLQGFPDNYTNIPWRKSADSPDGPRYKALGNSMAVPVMQWIGQRIQKLEEGQ